MRVFIFLVASFLLAISITTAFAGDKERPFRRGRGGFRGNERSERVFRIGVGNATFRGTGCPEGTMRVAFAPDNLSFSVLFDQFVAEVGAGSRQRRDLMTCNAIIPVEIPEGVQMEITRVDFRGFVNVPKGGKAVLNSVFNFTERGGGGDRDRINLRYKFEGPLAETYEISTGAVSEGQVAQTEVSPCGGTTNLRIQNNLMVSSGPKGEMAQATLDSIDGSSNAIYYVNWKKCEIRQPGRPDRPGRGNDRGEGRDREDDRNHRGGRGFGWR